MSGLVDKHYDPRRISTWNALLESVWVGTNPENGDGLSYLVPIVTPRLIPDRRRPLEDNWVKSVSVYSTARCISRRVER